MLHYTYSFTVTNLQNPDIRQLVSSKKFLTHLSMEYDPKVHGDHSVLMWFLVFYYSIKSIFAVSSLLSHWIQEKTTFSFLHFVLTLWFNRDQEPQKWFCNPLQTDISQLFPQLFWEIALIQHYVPAEALRFTISFISTLELFYCLLH